MLMLLVGDAGAQTDPPDWHKYTVKSEQFSVALPARPALDYRRVRVDSGGDRLEITLGTFVDGVLYLIQVFENGSSSQSLDAFIKDRAKTGWRPWNRKTESKLTLDGVSGKAFSFEGIGGAVQFFSKSDRLFQFAAVGAPRDDARVTKYFSSISLVDNKDTIELSPPSLAPPDGPSSLGLRPNPASSLTTVTPDEVFTPKEVDKSYQVVMMVHPEYTEDAREKQIKGTVVLQCVLTSRGHIRNIRTVAGLPYGLTEKAIAAARRLKFIPAMKDGKYVSVSTRLVYTFDLF